MTEDAVNISLWTLGSGNTEKKVFEEPVRLFEFDGRDIKKRSSGSSVASGISIE